MLKRKQLYNINTIKKFTRQKNTEIKEAASKILHYRSSGFMTFNKYWPTHHSGDTVIVQVNSSSFIKVKHKPSIVLLIVILLLATNILFFKRILQPFLRKAKFNHAQMFLKKMYLNIFQYFLFLKLSGRLPNYKAGSKFTI